MAANISPLLQASAIIQPTSINTVRRQRYIPLFIKNRSKWGDVLRIGEDLGFVEGRQACPCSLSRGGRRQVNRHAFGVLLVPEQKSPKLPTENSPG